MCVCVCMLASPEFFNCKLKFSGLNYNGSQCTVHTHINAGEKNKNAYKNCTIRLLLCYNSIYETNYVTIEDRCSRQSDVTDTRSRIHLIGLARPDCPLT